MGVISKATSPVRFLWRFGKENLNPIKQVGESVDNIMNSNLSLNDHIVDENGDLLSFDPSDVFEENVKHFNLSKADLKKKENTFYKTGLFNAVLAFLSSALISYFLINQSWFALYLSLSSTFIWSMISLHNFYRAWQIRERKLEKFVFFLKNPECWFR